VQSGADSGEEEEARLGRWLVLFVSLACFLSVEKTKNFNQSASRHLPPPAQAISYRHRLLLAPASRPPAAVPSGAPAALNRLRRSPLPGRRLTGSNRRPRPEASLPPRPCRWPTSLLSSSKSGSSSGRLRCRAARRRRRATKIG